MSNPESLEIEIEKLENLEELKIKRIKELEGLEIEKLENLKRIAIENLERIETKKTGTRKRINSQSNKQIIYYFETSKRKKNDRKMC